MIRSEKYTVCLVIDDSQPFENHPFFQLYQLCPEKQVDLQPWISRKKTGARALTDDSFLSHLADNHGDLWLAYSKLWQFGNGHISEFFQILHFNEYWHAVLELWNQKTRNETFCIFIYNLKKIHDGVRTILSEDPPDADIYHSWGGSLELFRALQGASSNKKPLVMNLTGNVELSQREFEKLLTREATNYTRCIWTDSENTAQYLKNIGVHPDSVRSTPWGLAKPLKSIETDFQKSPANRVFTIGILGPFTPQKDIKTVFIALGLLKTSLLDIDILLLDAENRHESYWDDCQLLAESLGIANDMILGDSSKISQMEIDILIIPNVDDSDESPIRLAFESGIIPVLPEIESNIELLHRNQAFLYTPFDPENLFNRLLHLYQNEGDTQIWYNRFLKELILDTQPENQMQGFTRVYSSILTGSQEDIPNPKKTNPPDRSESLKESRYNFQPIIGTLISGFVLVFHSRILLDLKVVTATGFSFLSLISIWLFWIRPREKNLRTLLTRFKLSLQRGTPEEWLVVRYSMEVRKLIIGLLFFFFFLGLPIFLTLWFMISVWANSVSSSVWTTIGVTLGASIATGSFGIGLLIQTNQMLGKAVSIQNPIPGMFLLGIPILFSIGEILFFETVLGTGLLIGAIVYLGGMISALIRRYTFPERYLVSLACK